MVGHGPNRPRHLDFDREPVRVPGREIRLGETSVFRFSKVFGAFVMALVMALPASAYETEQDTLTTKAAMLSGYNPTVNYGKYNEVDLKGPTPASRLEDLIDWTYLIADSVGAVIDSAFLEVYVSIFDYSCLDGDGTFRVSPATVAWYEHTVTLASYSGNWDDAYAVDVVIGCPQTNGDVYRIDVTAIVQAWVDGDLAQYGFYLRIPTGGGRSRFASDDYATTPAYRPRLVVDSSDAPLSVRNPPSRAPFGGVPSGVSVGAMAFGDSRSGFGGG
jgi:hypothetical protein